MCGSAPALAQNAASFDAAAAFGARPSVFGMRLSPDGKSVSYLVPAEGQGSMVKTLSLAPGATSRVALSADGKPERLWGCSWVSNDRLVCTVYGLFKEPMPGGEKILSYSRIVAVNADGTNLRLLSRRDNPDARAVALAGGDVIDLLPDQDGAVLMARVYVPEDKIGTHLASNSQGLGVDLINTRDLAAKRIEAPRIDAAQYITDGRGTVRIEGRKQGTGKSIYQDNGIVAYMYRARGSDDWHPLSNFDLLDQTGFRPVAVDPELNVAYGFKKLNGRMALYSVTLDGSLREDLVYANPEVDVDGLIQIGRRRHVVGAGYVTDVRQAYYFAPQIQQLLGSLHKALPQQPLLHVVDSSMDENAMLVIAGSDSDPGVYYLFDRGAHRLQTFLVLRKELEGVKLATVRSVSYPASDGVLIPGYLTLPPGVASAKGLPAIVMPHGGPSARDEWGFNWLSQFYASRGFAVLQPNFRGSLGYGDDWLLKNGIQSWHIAIADVIAGGRWLVSQGADPARLAIVGWSYGGYAALQSAVVDPSVFKAVIAVAPVTDLVGLREYYNRTGGYEFLTRFMGESPHLHEGSPIEHVDRIKVPVLLFHGGLDGNVDFQQSKRMCERLTAVGGKCELVSWAELDHQLDDSAARTQMLRRSDEFLRSALGM
jgi:acetyl esterase/lipase